MEEYEVISIPVSDGTERDFAIMDTFEFEGQGYLAVSLIEGDEIQHWRCSLSFCNPQGPYCYCERSEQ